MNKSFFPSIGAILIILFSVGCLSESLQNIDGIIAEPELALPIGKISFELKEFIENDTVFSVTTNGLAQVIYREDNIASLSATDLLDDFSDIWSLNITEEKQIGIIEIDDITNSGFYALKAVVNEMNDPVIQQAFRNNDGSMAPLPAFSEDVNFDIGMPPFANYKNIKIDSGSLILSINNGFSFGLENVIFEIYDNITGNFIDKFNKNTIAPGEIFNYSIDLTGKTINNEFFIKIPTFQSPGSITPILIDLEQRMSVSVTTSDLKIRKGEVEVPAITLPVIDEIMDIDVDNGVKLIELKMKEGKLKYDILSEILVPVEVIATIPTMTNNGIGFSERILLSSGTASGEFDLSGYEVDLESDPSQPYNRLPVKLEVYSPGSGTDLVAFDQNDKITAEFELTDLEMQDFRGNAGSYTEKLDSSELDFEIDFSFLDPETKRLFLENPKIEIFYENSFGIPLESEINALAFGHFGATETLDAPKFVMDFPTIAQIGTTVSGTYSINSGNSNISDVLSIFPERIKYSGEVNVNPDSNDNLDNFVSTDSRLNVGLNLELPLQFKTQNLVYRDTVSQEPVAEENPDEVESLVLVLDYKNDMPFTTTVDLSGAESGGTESIILENISINSADLDPNGRPNGTKEGRIEIELSKAEIESLLNKDMLILTIRLMTGTDGNTPVGIYTTDGIEIGLAARIQLKIEE